MKELVKNFITGLLNYTRPVVPTKLFNNSLAENIKILHSYGYCNTYNNHRKYLKRQARIITTCPYDISDGALLTCISKINLLSFNLGKSIYRLTHRKHYAYDDETY